MNRPFKVRVWNSFKKQMFYLEGMQTIELYDDGSGQLKDENGKILTEISDENPLMYFTGIKDKNDKDIFERDVCPEGVVAWSNKIGYDGGGGMHSGFYIENRSTKEEGLEYIDLNYHLDLTEIEVIGNIYENSNLLKQK